MLVGVTGGSGFLGTWIAKQLKANGHGVMVLDHVSRAVSHPYADELLLGDVRDETATMELAAHVDGIIHLAAVLGTQETINNPIPSAITNVIGSLNIFEAANHYNLPVVYAGVGNYAFRDIGTGSYTISKTCAEDYARMHNLYRKGRISIVRPVNAYGPYQSVAAPYGPSKVRKIMPAMICRALTNTPIEIYGDGTQISDCVYVADVARTFVAALECQHLANEPLSPVEVGPERSATVNAIAYLVLTATQARGYPVQEPLHAPMRPGEVPNAIVRADTSTLAPLGLDAAGFVPLEDGIGRTVDYFIERWLPSHKAVS